MEKNKQPRVVASAVFLVATSLLSVAFAGLTLFSLAVTPEVWDGGWALFCGFFTLLAVLSTRRSWVYCVQEWSWSRFLARQKRPNIKFRTMLDR